MTELPGNEALGVEQEVQDAVRRILATSPTFYLSTTANDEPWGAGAFFAEAGMFDLTIVLELQGRTLRNIRQNPKVAMVVSSGDPFDAFLQGAANAEVFEDEQHVAEAAGVLRAKAPQIEPILGAPIAALHLHVTQWRVTDLLKGWFPGKELRPQ